MPDTIQSLGLADRLRLLDELSESVAQEMAAAPLTEAQRNELDRRLATDRSRAVPSAQVHAEIRARLKP